MSLENDIFNNPLEAFPEFLDDTVPQAVEEPAQETPAPAPEPEVKPKNKYTPSYSSANYVDPLDTIEEIDLSALSDLSEELTFAEDTPVTSADTDISFFEKTNLTIGSIEYEDVAVRRTDSYLDIDDSVPDEITETEEVSVDDFLSTTGSETEEIDLDAFLGDSGFTDSAAPSPAGGSITEEVSLDDFGVDFGAIDSVSIDAFAASARQEKSDIENAPAIDMELEFDDDFVLETKANPEDDIDFDFEALMAGESVQIPQTGSTGDELLDNFDDIFDNIVDETSPAPQSSGSEIEFDPSAIEEVSLDDFGLGGGVTSLPSEGDAEKVSEQQIVFDEVSEFDDLLSSFSDETHVEVADNRSNHESVTGPRDYNIIVVMDEDDDSIAIPQAPVIEEKEDEEEDYQINIFKNDEEAASFRNHQSVPAASSSFEPSSSGDVPVASAPASDTFEDISLDDFGVAFEDETPVEKPAATEEESVIEEEPAATEETVEPFITEEPVFDDEIAVPETPDEGIFEEEQIMDMEPPETPTECEDTAIDDKKIVELSEDCVYNGDNKYTSTMNDDYNEEITDTMDSMNEGLLEKIVSELSVLRSEMQNLREEVQTLKDGSEPVAVEATSDPVVQEDVNALPEEEIPVPEADPFAVPQQEAGGFFSGDDDDETIALSGDELNNILNSADFTQEDGSNFGMEAPEGSVLPDGLGDDFTLDEPAAEETAVSEEAPAEEPSFDDFNMEEPASEEPVADDFSLDEPAVEETAVSEEAPAEEPSFDDFNMEEPAAEEPAADDFSLDEPAIEEPAVTEEAPVEESSFDAPVDATEEVSIDDFNTDLPSLKEDEPSEEIVTEEPVAAETESDDFSLDDFDIPEPKVEDSIGDIDIDEPEEPKADSFSLDEFDIPEPEVDETSIDDINIEESSAEIPEDEGDLMQDEAPAAETPAEDADFYANSDSPAISEDDITGIDIQDNLEEPVLDDIDFGLDEPASNDIDIPTGDDLVVDSSSTDFLEEDPTIEEQLTSEKVDYLNEEASVDDLASLPEIDEPLAVEGMEDSLEADTLATSEDETPADDVFSSQWDAPETEEESVPVSEPEEEFVKASSSFDDPVSFDLDEPATDIPADEPEISTSSDFDAPVESEEAAPEEPAFEEPAPAPAEEGLNSDIKQEVKSVLKYMDQLLENLPEDKIAEFAQSEHFDTYKKLFNELGLV